MIKDWWLKFCPKDWNGDRQLRMCSLSARGLWAAFLEPMHEAEPYGYLLLNGQKPTYEELAIVATCSVREVKYGIEELIKNGVASVREDGALYSRRMVRDGLRRTRRRENGSLGGNPRLKGEVNHIDNHDVNQIDKSVVGPIASSYLASSSSSEFKENELDLLLDRFLREVYPPEGYQRGWETEQAWVEAFENVDRSAQYLVLQAAVEQHKKSQRWRDGKIPFVTRWLKEKRWNQRLREVGESSNGTGDLVTKAAERLARDEARYGKQ